MFGDAEHYKYLTNEADLNNVGDDSMALTPKTPKKVRKSVTQERLNQLAISKMLNCWFFRRRASL